jgi:pimeloyl-ACP methyl ester carboxylesterase
MRITTDDGVGLEVEVEGTGPGLLLLHGHGGAKEDFADHVPTLARDHTVVVFDHRGHGESDKPDAREAYSLERLAADTLEVADAAGLDSFRLLGHSMGGMVARKVVLRASERVDALVMLDSCAAPIPGFPADLMEAGAEVAFTRGKVGLKELFDFASPLDTPAYLALLETRPGYQEYVDKKFEDYSATMWGAMAVAMAHQSDDMAALGNALRAPLLILVGEQDEPFLIASRLMYDAIAGSQLVVIPDAGHSPQLENPRAWIEALTGFLTTVRANAR